MTDETMRMSEEERRELANAHRGDLIGEGEEITPRRLAQMVSLRLESEIVDQLRQLADDRGVSMSDLLREGADCVIARWRGTREVVHFSYSSSVFPGRIPNTGGYDVVLHRVPAQARASAARSPEPSV